MSEVASAYVSLIPSFRGGTGAISKALGSGVDGAGKDAGRRFGTGVIGGLSGMKGAITGVLGGLLAFQGARAVFRTVGDAVVGFNSELQQSSIAFTTMLGSGTKAQSLLNDLKTFARTTPFEFPDLVTASQRLIAMGVNASDVIPYMTGIGDAVAGLGGGADKIDQVVTAIGQMSAKGKIQSDELLQLTEAGIPALKILADQYHVTTAEMSNQIQQGKIMASDALPKLISGLEHGTASTAAFGGMMAKQSVTFSGAMSNIKDSLTQTLATAGRPFFDEMSSGAQSLANMLGSKGVADWASQFAANTKAGLASAKRDLGQFLDGFKHGSSRLDITDGVIPGWQRFGIVANGVVGSVNRTVSNLARDAAPQLAQIKGALTDAFETNVKPRALDLMSQTLASLQQSAQKLKPYLDQLWSQFGPTVTNLLPPLLQLAQALSPVSIIVHAILPVLPQFADAFGKIAVAVANALLPLLPTLVSLLADVATVMSGGLTSALTAVLPMVASLAGALAPVAPYLLGAWGAFKGAQAAASGVSTLKDKVTGAYDSVVAFKGKITDGIASVKEFGGQIKSGAETVKLWALYAKDGAKRAVALGKSVAASAVSFTKQTLATAKSAASMVASKIATIASTVATGAMTAAQWLLNVAMSANPIALVVLAITALIGIFVVAYLKVGWFRDAVNAAFGAIVGAAQAVWHGIEAAFDAVKDFLAKWGVLILVVMAPFIGVPLLIVQHFHAIIDGLRGIWNTVVGDVKGFVGHIVDGIKSIPGLILKINVEMLNAGKSLIGSFFDGIKKAVTGIGGVAEDMGKAIAHGLIHAINSFLHLPLKIPRINTHIPHVGTVGGQTLLPAIPDFADGGIVPATPGGRIIRVAEAGQAEAVIPLDRLEGLRGGGRDAPVVAGDLVLNEVTDTVGTARAVTRRLAHLGAV